MDCFISFRTSARVGTRVDGATCCWKAMSVSPFAMTRGDAIESMGSKSVQVKIESIRLRFANVLVPCLCSLQGAPSVHQCSL